MSEQARQRPSESLLMINAMDDSVCLSPLRDGYDDMY